MAEKRKKKIVKVNAMNLDQVKAQMKKEAKHTNSLHYEHMLARKQELEGRK